MFVDLSVGIAQDGFGGTDTLVNIEQVRGSEFGDDTLIGDAGNNRLEGRDGNDTLIGGEGFDNLSGGSGDDTLDGSAGGHDFLEGGLGNDVLIGSAGDGGTASYHNASSGIVADLSAGLVEDGDGGTDILTDINSINAVSYTHLTLPTILRV